MGMRQKPFLPSLSISLKGCRKGGFLLPGAALTCQACVPGPEGMQQSVPLPLQASLLQRPDSPGRHMEGAQLRV